MPEPEKKRYKVLHIITRLIVGGAQENTIYTAELLDPRKYDVDVLCGPQVGPEGSLQQDAIQRGANVRLLNRLVREINPIKDLTVLFQLIHLIRRKRYDIVHTHSSKAGIVGRWAAWLAGCPIIVHTVHGWGFHDYQKSWLRLIYIVLERITLFITDKLIAVSEKDIIKGIEAGIGHSDRYTLIRSGINLDDFQNPFRSREEVRQEFKIDKNAAVIGTVTRLSPQKAPKTFVRIAEVVLKMRPDAYFVVVGDGPLFPDIKRYAVSAGIEKRLILTGIRRDVPDLLGAFDIFLLSSLWEGLPRVIPQAMSAGIPVIASEVDGNAEIITNMVNGILVKPNDIEGAADAILSLLDNPDTAKRLAARAMKSVDEYCVNKMVKTIDRLYMDCLQRLQYL